MSVMNIRVRTTSSSAKPPSARARSMIAKTARAWPAMSPGCCDVPSGPASVVPATQHASPTTTARLYPATRSHGPPDEIRSVARRSLRGGEPRVVGPPGEDLGIAGDRQQQPGQHRRPRHDRVDLEVLGRRMVVAADRSEAVEGRDAHAGRRVRIRRAAGRGVVHLEARAAPRPPGRARRGGRCGRASPSAARRPSRAASTVVPSTSVVATRSRIGGFDLAPGRRRSSPGRRPRARSAPGRRWVACRRRSCRR